MKYATVHCSCGWADRENRYGSSDEARRAAARHAFEALRVLGARPHHRFYVRWHES